MNIENINIENINIENINIENINIRNANKNDIDNIYKLQIECFPIGDVLYKPFLFNLIDNAFVAEFENNIVGFLLQGKIIACDKLINNNFDIDKFVSLNSDGDIFEKNNYHIKEHYGIIMLCVDKKFRNKQIAQILIKKHIDNYKCQINNTLNSNLILITRKSNIAAQNLYLKMNYKCIAEIENKYYNPTEAAMLFEFYFY
jgi:ribosomal protein S18 acetylase RimI-like enzyme